MLRLLGFLTGCALTAALAAAALEPGLLQSLRASAGALMTGAPPPIGPVPENSPVAVPGAGMPAPAAIRAPAPRPPAADAHSTPGASPESAAAATDAEPPAATPAPAADAPPRDGSATGEPMPEATSWDSAPPRRADAAGSPETAAASAQATDGEDGPVGGAWHAFWTPFHSEASASGFARHLERATGESYRVVRTGPGAYRVAFWHEGDDERSRRLMAIEQASGLRLRGGTL